LTAFGHVLEDELHRYLNPSSQYDSDTSDEDKLGACAMMNYLKEQHPDEIGVVVSEAEQRQLRAWLKGVQTRIHQEDELILENVVTVWELQDTEEHLRQLRQACMAMRLQNRRLERQVHVLQQQVQQQEQDALIEQRANDFLHFLDDL
jgi:hypothetical protein